MIDSVLLLAGGLLAGILGGLLGLGGGIVLMPLPSRLLSLAPGDRRSQIPREPSPDP